MSRGKSAALTNSARRQKDVDNRYSSESVAKLIRSVMKNGQASKARKIVYQSMTTAAEKLPKHIELAEHEGVRQKEAMVLEKVLEMITPRVEVKSRRVGGANYQVPMMVNRDRGRTLALRWLVESARDRKEGAPMHVKLFKEMLETLEGKSSALMKKETQDKMANANRANANLARRDQAKKDKTE